MKFLQPVVVVASLAIATLVSSQQAQAAVDDDFACYVSGGDVSCDVLVESSGDSWTLNGTHLAAWDGYGYLGAQSCNGAVWTVSVTYDTTDGSTQTHTHSGGCH